MNTWKNIINPINYKLVSTKSNLGKYILKKYILKLKGSALSEEKAIDHCDYFEINNDIKCIVENKELIKFLFVGPNFKNKDKNLENICIIIISVNKIKNEIQISKVAKSNVLKDTDYFIDFITLLTHCEKLKSEYKKNKKQCLFKSIQKYENSLIEIFEKSFNEWVDKISDSYMDKWDELGIPDDDVFDMPSMWTRMHSTLEQIITNPIRKYHKCLDNYLSCILKNLHKLKNLNGEQFIKINKDTIFKLAAEDYSIVPILDMKGNFIANKFLTLVKKYIKIGFKIDQKKFWLNANKIMNLSNYATFETVKSIKKETDKLGVNISQISDEVDAVVAKSGTKIEELHDDINADMPVL
jgi:hypothetical protein